MDEQETDSNDPQQLAGEPAPANPARRGFFRFAGAVAASAAAPASALAATQAATQAAGKSATQAPQATTTSAHHAYTFFNPEEAAFIEAATERLIPADENGPGATDAGVSFYIDKQLSAAWGAGERLYRAGPWHEGAPTQGYQLPYTPAELFRHALRGVRANLASSGKQNFAKLSAQEQDAYLKQLEGGKVDLDGVPSSVFFSSLLEVTIEGYFSDPVYGGNRDMVSWKMIGFPGAYASFYQLVDQHGVAYQRAPISLADNGRGVIHIHPDIRATVKGGNK
jgi:gluconate 2-dehydrogenase gamma chain